MILSLPKKWIKTLFITSLAIVCPFIGGEIWARYFDCPQPYSALFVYDEVLGYRSPASTQVAFSAGEQTYQVAFDENGIADRAGEGNVEVVILGDGVTAGLELPPKERLAHKISSLMNGKGVINLSITGYGTIQQSMLLEDWLSHSKVHPKHVMLIFNLSNDVIDNVREWDGAGNPNVLLANHDGMILKPVLPDQFYRQAARYYHESRLAGYLSNLRQHLVDDQLQGQLNGLFSPQLPVEMENALLGTKAGFVKLEQLKQKYRFKLHGVFWVDMGLFDNIPKEGVENAMRHIRQLTLGVDWNPSVALGGTNESGENWSKKFLVYGTHHANFEAMLKVSKELSSSITE